MESDGFVDGSDGINVVDVGESQVSVVQTDLPTEKSGAIMDLASRGTSQESQMIRSTRNNPNWNCRQVMRDYAIVEE